MIQIEIRLNYLQNNSSLTINILLLTLLYDAKQTSIIYIELSYKMLKIKI